ncbi:EF-hand calcium-binding domain-containing protein 14 isoform X1 [Ranitomeya variabilis]|uniref:EF-hand calcium-binding domain-containing protein 14 isoform X1 n=1 Tax=Ranitomeya variabilis TaxID=490064 RepID=UPI004056A97E
MGSGALSAGIPAAPAANKKMKKRKELNALIGLAGDGGRKKAKKGSGHRLLRTEPPASDSDTYTEEDEFSALGEGRGRCGRWSVLRCCRLCYPLCGFIVLAACVVTCIGLVWMQVVLKENIDALREQFKAMESTQRSSGQEIPKINEDLMVKQRRLEEIESGDKGLNRLWANITEVNKQIALLTTAVTQLKISLKSASNMINLPKTMEELQKSVATLGSTLTSVHHDVETLQIAAEEQKKKVEALQSDVTSEPSATAISSVLQVQDSLESLNSTLLMYVKQNDQRLLHMDFTMANLSQRLAALESSRLHYKEGGMVENSTYSSNASRADASENPKQEDVSDIQEQLQLIHVLTNAPDSDKMKADDAVTSPPQEKKNPRTRRRQQRDLLQGISTGQGKAMPLH